MVYDKEIFKAYYACGYFLAMKMEMGLFLLGVALRITGLSIFLGISLVLIFFIPFVFFPFTYCYYLRARNQAQCQKQWVVDGKLYVKRSYDNGYTAGGFVVHNETVIFDSIDEIVFSKRYIKVQGNIQVIESYNNVIREKNVNIYRIPRCFKNEEQILELGGIEDVGQ